MSWKERAADILASIIARFLIGFGAVVFFLIAYGYKFLRPEATLMQMGGIAAVVGVVAALLGVRTGPGLK